MWFKTGCASSRDEVSTNPVLRNERKEDRREKKRKENLSRCNKDRETDKFINYLKLLYFII